MFRRRTIMAIGEAILRELPDRDVPVGLAVDVPRRAVAFGHRGVTITRVGQDEAGARLVTGLRELSVDVDYLQYDPDLPTGREVVRAGRVMRPRLEEMLAFDNLQWDFDLADAGQVADAVVYGAFAGHGGQTRSSVDRFLTECTMALRVVDLTNRRAEDLPRSLAEACLRLADVAILDETALRGVLPSLDPEAWREGAEQLVRGHDVQIVLVREPGAPWRALASGAAHEGSEVLPDTCAAAATVGVIHAVLAGWPVDAARELAARCERHAHDHPDTAVPPEWLEAPSSSDGA
jgi:sugar/nucleoside kinase (ribokinase family)